MVLSPPPPARQAAPAAPRGPGAAGLGGRRGAAPLSPARSLPGAGAGFVCARESSARAGRRRTPAPSSRASAPRPAGGRVSAASGSGDPSSAPAAPSPPAPLLTDGATATTRRRRGCSQLLSPMLRALRLRRGARRGRGARREWQGARPIERAAWEVRAVTIGVWGGGGTALGGAAEWAEQDCGSRRPGARAVRGVREDARRRTRCVRVLKPAWSCELAG